MLLFETLNISLGRIQKRPNALLSPEHLGEFLPGATPVDEPSSNLLGGAVFNLGRENHLEEESSPPEENRLKGEESD